MNESLRAPGNDPPSYDELPEREGVRCSWGLWGEDDVYGCLNLLTDERVAAAARQVRRGTVFPLNLSMALPDPPLFSRARMRHEVRGSSRSTSQDELLHDWNTQASTQWDGFRHVRREGHGHYNGVPEEEHGVDHWARRGIVGRGVLADVALWRESVGRPLRKDAPDPIEPDDVVATLATQATSVEPGDVLILRTGWLEWYLATGEDTRRGISTPETLATPGLRASVDTARLLWDLHIAAVATDNPALETWPIGSSRDPQLIEEIRNDLAREHEILLHSHLLPMLGLPIGELFYLEDLAEDCRRDGRYSFLFTSAPINLPRGVASPPNALALK
jgi:kynurenine formamidase